MKYIQPIIIASLLMFMSLEFEYFIRHYEQLQNQLIYIVNNCKK